jgi:hypothetical protein
LIKGSEGEQMAGDIDLDPSGRPRSRPPLVIALAGVALIAVAGCAALARSAPTATEWTAAPGAVSPSAADATQSLEPTATDVPNATPTHEDLPTPDDTPTPDDLPTALPSEITSVGQTSTGSLRSIAWHPGPVLDTCDPGFDADGYATVACPEYQLFGWSKGYVAFAMTDTSTEDDAPRVAISVTSSKDGLHWTKPRQIWDGYIEIRDLVEGPNGLLAVGYSIGRVMCGPPDPTIHGLWFSADGASWSALSMARTFGGGEPDTISASARGYIATGGWSEPEVWMSTDAHHWTMPDLPFALYRSATVGGPVAFPGGFIIYGQIIVPGGCGGDSLEVSAIWYSRDGSGWTRETLPAVKASASVDTWVGPLTFSILAASEQTYDSDGNSTGEISWVSRDGQTWTAFDPPELANAGWSSYVTPQHSLIEVTSTTGPTAWYAIDDDLALTPLSVVGPDPLGEYVSCVIGPTGLVALDGSQIWIGVLS